MDLNIMATLDSKEEDVENFEQCTETTTQSEPETKPNQPTSHLSDFHTHDEKKNNSQASATPMMRPNGEPS